MWSFCLSSQPCLNMPLHVPTSFQDDKLRYWSWLMCMINIMSWFGVPVYEFIDTYEFRSSGLCHDSFFFWHISELLLYWGNFFCWHIIFIFLSGMMLVFRAKALQWLLLLVHLKGLCYSIFCFMLYFITNETSIYTCMFM
jgi:hypothetical protein